MHPGLISILSNSPSVSEVLFKLKNEESPILFLGAEGYAKFLTSACIFETLSRPGFMVFSSPEDAVTASRDLGDLLGSHRVVLFPAREVMPFETQGNQEALWMRLSCMERLIRQEGSNLLVVMPATAAFRKVMNAKDFRASIRKMTVGDQSSLEDIVSDLVSLGYKREHNVEQKGQLAVRGGILDIFPPSSDTPFRLEFAFDEIDSIRTFDIETQVSMVSVNEFTIIPATDLPLKVQEDQGKALSIEDTIFSYASPSLVMVDDMARCSEALKEFEEIGNEIASARMIAGAMGRNETSVYLPAEFIKGILQKSHLFFSLVQRPQGISFTDVLESDTSNQIGFSGRWNDFQSELSELCSRNQRVVILAGNKERRELLERWLKRIDMNVVSTDALDSAPIEGVVTLALGSGANGFNCEPIGLSVFTETEVYGRALVKRKKTKKSKLPLNWRELSVGDYVVHANHGIGQFMGIKTMTVAGVTRDYLHIRYYGTDALYVPTDQVDMVEKYVGPEGRPPTLQKLGTGDWQKIKAKVKASVEDMARKLLVLEAKRKSHKGFAFSPDTPWQQQFENSFEYEETEDQMRATLEIKRDMEKSEPMDRLLCGDVGFGKTEVAMRCAFKAVMDSKQVAVLVPTTILAEQHYNTFMSRFADFPVSIQVLSRFRTSAERKRILNDLASGAVDIVIGTHTLLSKDVEFSNLGLLIIDEEHRFGVAQKERLKEIGENCDVLTLTATPIPRTLNMALSGIRDISVIETPPEGRFPVETYVVADNPSLIAQAIRREMRRGGQIFYVHNRVFSIGRVYQRVKNLVPEARITIAHGKMRETELSRTMQEFLQGRYDVLISTTIIESGLDLPNVNTLIVEDADKLGLAQLYQLRGRVGRSDRIAYAYFTYRQDRTMTVVAEERLNALRDFSTMGSGFKLAMRGMEIRGAGNLLGPEQHGFMTLVGYDMYLSLLEMAVKNLKGQKEERQERILTQVDLPIDAYIPDSYVENARERFSFYKRIAAADDLETISDIEEEIQDRFGDCPPEVKNLLDVSRVRIMAGKIGITQVVINRTDLTFGRDRLTFKIEVPHIFPTQRLEPLFRDYPNLEMDRRLNSLSLNLPMNSPSTLDISLKVLNQLSDCHQ